MRELRVKVSGVAAPGVTKLWITTVSMTGQVNVDGRGTVTFAPPVWGRFVGQSFTNLERWLVCGLHLDFKIVEL